MQDLLAKDRQGCRPRAACERKEPPQEEKRQAAQKAVALETAGDNGIPPPSS